MEDDARLRSATLAELLSRRAQATPDQVALAFLKDGDEQQTLTYAELDARARAVASRLNDVADRGERALIFQLPGIEYVASFFGCLYAGVTAVPVFPPRFNQRLERIQTIVEDSRARVALTSLGLRTQVAGALGAYPALKTLTWLATDDEADRDALDSWPAPEILPDTLAMLQYTSGSTAHPKGVMLSHANLLANLSVIHESFGLGPESRGMIWLPPYHDMGLIGGILEPIYGGFPLSLMSPYAFLQRPIRWLQSISRLQATCSGGPNFAYDLCARKVTDEQLAELDLSSWRLAFCGAEPIQPEVIERFTKRFAPAGFKAEAFYPCYGLAEATLMVSGGRRDADPVIRSFDGAALERHEIQPGGRALVGCGSTFQDHEIAIVDPATLKRVPQGSDARVGEIWFRGPSKARGYWGRPEDTEREFNARILDEAGAAETGDPWLRTGDLGFLQDGELFVTGRIKDLMIFRGRNVYPQDVERTVEAAHPALRPGSCAIFSVPVAAPEAAGERLVVVQELDRSSSKGVDPTEIVEAIRAKVFAEHEIHAYAVGLIRANSLPKTSSGKIQRQATRKRFLEQDLEETHRYVSPDAY